MKCIRLKNDKILDKYTRRFFAAHKLDGTWCQLFKSKGYKRLDQHKKYTQQALWRYVEKNYDVEKSAGGNPLWTIKKVPDLGLILFWRDINE